MFINIHFLFFLVSNNDHKKLCKKCHVQVGHNNNFWIFFLCHFNIVVLIQNLFVKFSIHFWNLAQFNSICLHLFLEQYLSFLKLNRKLFFVFAMSKFISFMWENPTTLTRTCKIVEHHQKSFFATHMCFGKDQMQHNRNIENHFMTNFYKHLCQKKIDKNLNCQFVVCYSYNGLRITVSLKCNHNAVCLCMCICLPKFLEIE